MSEWIVYVTSEADSGRYYIGKTSRRRFEEGYLGSGLWVANARRKGRCLSSSILSEEQSEKAAYDAEVFFVQCCKEDSLCMNISDGGDGCNWDLAGPGIRAFWSDPEKAAKAHAKRSETIRAWWAAKRDRSFSAETRARMSDAHKGRRHSEEAKLKISTAQKGRKFSDETRMKMKLSAQVRWSRDHG